MNEPPLDRDELIGALCGVTSFLTGYGPAAEIACQKLRDLMNDMERRGLEAAEPLEDAIDTSDIPEATAEWFARAKRKP